MHPLCSLQKVMSWPLFFGALGNGVSAAIEANRMGNGHPFDLDIDGFGPKRSVRSTGPYKGQIFLRSKEPVAVEGDTTLTLVRRQGNWGVRLSPWTSTSSSQWSSGSMPTPWRPGSPTAAAYLAYTS
ncbi:hypothetical protein GCM10017710_12830 [Arthrobacter ramosus]